MCCAEVDAAAGASAKLFVRFPLPLIARFPTSVKLAGEIVDEGFMFRPLDLQLDAKAAALDEQRNASTHTAVHRDGQIVEESPLASPLAASPFVLHHPSEEITADSARHMMQQLQEDAKNKVLFFGTDSF